MSHRSSVMLIFIAVLVALATYINLDVFVPGYRHPSGLTRILAWQGEPPVRHFGLRRGLDLQGGVQVLLEADERAVMVADPGDMDIAAGIIRNRVDSLGVAEAAVQTQGDNKIVVALPGVDDPDLAVRTIGTTAQLEFIYGGNLRDPVQGPNIPQPGELVVTSLPRLYGELPDEYREPRLVNPDQLDAVRGITISEASDVDVTEVVTPTGTVRLYPTIITGGSVRTANVGRDQFNQPVVEFTLDGDGGRRMQQFTSSHRPVGVEQEHVMPIVLDKRIISSPVVRDTIASSGQISGDFTVEEANSLVVQLRSGSLPVELEVVGRTQIGPTLGAESVSLAVVGGMVGIAAVMGFMVLYYRLPGLIASLALVIYVLYSLALFRTIPVTLTLAGIAGFVLSIGMAVDANILIFERMKEELRAGRRMRAAMETGFERAWPSIRDSNLSTLITCAILFWFGNQFGASIVKGFAVTLSVGVLTSMFTAITVTRAFLDLSNRLLLRGAMTRIPVESPRLRTMFGL